MQPPPPDGRTSVPVLDTARKVKLGCNPPLQATKVAGYAFG
jgi:hypothetical protein